MDKNTCDACKHYKPASKAVPYDILFGNPDYKNSGECELMTHSGEQKPFVGVDRVSSWSAEDPYAEKWSSGCYVGPKFGCIHWMSATP
jgi:hypothetical protein